jgi:hypothetical protein|tara:strand:- start:1217 stop:1450 length:234 start_codon:yes stop_codon:yes gene_type:complete
MLEEKATDTLNKTVLNPDFIEEQIDRLLAWEIFIRQVRGKDQEEMLPLELCDRIGVSILYINHLLEDIKKRPQFYAK